MKIYHIFSPLVVTNAAYGTGASQSNVLFAVSPVIEPRTALSLDGAGIAINPVTWPENARRPGSKYLLQFLLTLNRKNLVLKDESSASPPVDKSPDPDETSVPDKDPDKLPAVIVSDNLPAEPATDKPPAAVIDNDVSMTDKEKPTAAATDNDVPMKPHAKSSCAPPSDISTVTSAMSKSSGVPTPSRTVMTAKMFSVRISELYPFSDLPDFDNVKGKEWDTRAKAFIRRRINEMFTNQEIGLSDQDFVAWTEEEIFDVSTMFSRILGVRDYLVEFIHGLLRSHWRKIIRKTNKS